MLFILPFYTFYLELHLCHTNTGFLCMTKSYIFRNFFLVQKSQQISESQISWSVHSTFLPENMEQTKNAERCAKYCSVNKEKIQLLLQSSNSKDRRSQLVEPLRQRYFQNTDSLLLYCYIRQNDRRKAISRKIDQKKEICQCDISLLESHLLIYLNSFQCYVVILVFGPSFVL